MKLILHKIFKTRKLATAYHEAGHCVVAALFEDKITLKALSINKAKMKEIDENYNGGPLLEWINKPYKSDYQSGDYLILIALAGICANTIYRKGHSYTRKHIPVFKKNPGLLDDEGAFDDYEIVNMYSPPISQHLKIKKEIIEWSALRWNLEFLMIPEIWEATGKIAEEIIKHPNQTLNDKEITGTIQRLNLRSYLDSNKKNFLLKRYPLTTDSILEA